MTRKALVATSFLLELLVLNLSAPARAQQVFVEFLDFTAPAKAKVEFGFESSDLLAKLQPAEANTLTKLLAELTAPPTSHVASEMDALYDALDGLRDEGTSRFVSKVGDQILTCAIHEAGKSATVEGKEEPRSSRFAKDLRTLLPIILAAPLVHDMTCIGLVLEEVRATVTLKSTSSGKSLAATVITGPTEHLYLSLNLPVTKLDEIKYNDTSGALETKKTPASFYGGIDYFLGDLANPKSSGAVAMVLLSASRKPLDSFGLALGWRFADMKKGDFKLNSFSPFVGYVWTLSDSVSSDGSPDRDSSREGNVVAGLAFNLDAGAAWLKKAIE